MNKTLTLEQLRNNSYHLAIRSSLLAIQSTLSLQKAMLQSDHDTITNIKSTIVAQNTTLQNTTRTLVEYFSKISTFQTPPPPTLGSVAPLQISPPPENSSTANSTTPAPPTVPAAPNPQPPLPLFPTPPTPLYAAATDSTTPVPPLISIAAVAPFHHVPSFSNPPHLNSLALPTNSCFSSSTPPVLLPGSPPPTALAALKPYTPPPPTVTTSTTSLSMTTNPLTTQPINQKSFLSTPNQNSKPATKPSLTFHQTPPIQHSIQNFLEKQISPQEMQQRSHDSTNELPPPDITGPSNLLPPKLVENHNDITTKPTPIQTSLLTCVSSVPLMADPNTASPQDKINYFQTVTSLNKPDPQLSDPPDPQIDNLPQLSFHAFVGSTNPKSLCPLATVNTKPISMFIDSGSTYEYFHLHAACYLGLKLDQQQAIIAATVGNRDKLRCNDVLAGQGLIPPVGPTTESPNTPLNSDKLHPHIQIVLAQFQSIFEYDDVYLSYSIAQNPYFNMIKNFTLLVMLNFNPTVKWGESNCILFYMDFVECTKAIDESKFFTFDPGGTFDITENISDLEDKVDFEGSTVSEYDLIG